jgi:hypothetical protein
MKATQEKTFQWSQVLVTVFLRRLQQRRLHHLFHKKQFFKRYVFLYPGDRKNKKIKVSVDLGEHVF